MRRKGAELICNGCDRFQHRSSAANPYPKGSRVTSLEGGPDEEVRGLEPEPWFAHLLALTVGPPLPMKGECESASGLSLPLRVGPRPSCWIPLSGPWLQAVGLGQTAANPAGFGGFARLGFKPLGKLPLSTNIGWEALNSQSRGV